MKELTIEQKAKAYDEAIKEAAIAHKDKDKHLKTTLERIFPELKESEGERIRKELISFVRNDGWKFIKLTKEEKESWIAWLEKQGEQKPIWHNEDEEQSKNWILEYLYDGLRKSDEQFKDQFKSAIAWLQKQGQTFTKKDAADAYLKGVCDTKHELEKQCGASHQQRVEDAMQEVEEKAKIFTEAFQGKTSEEILAEMRGEQKPIEWSTEDEKMAERLLGWLDTLANYIHYDAIVSLDLRRERMQQVQQLKTWLKSLKSQKQWKPSEEQMKALNAINVTGCISYAGQGQELINLYNDLKKLKG